MICTSCNNKFDKFEQVDVLIRHNSDNSIIAKEDGYRRLFICPICGVVKMENSKVKIEIAKPDLSIKA